jgi:hypothetical protein
MACAESGGGHSGLGEQAARRTGDAGAVARARAFRTYCIEKRADGEAFHW